jgi:anti-sigma B factor antagonist
MEELARMTTEREDGRLLVRVEGEIDLSNVHVLEREIELAVTGSPHVVIDLSEVAYIDSQGLRLLSQLSKRLTREGSTLQVVAPLGTFARGILDLTMANGDIEILDTA